MQPTSDHPVGRAVALAAGVVLVVAVPVAYALSR